MTRGWKRYLYHSIRDDDGRRENNDDDDDRGYDDDDGRGDDDGDDGSGAWMTSAVQLYVYHDYYPPSGQDTTLRNRMSLSDAPLSSSTDRALSAGISIDRSIDQC